MNPSFERINFAPVTDITSGGASRATVEPYLGLPAALKINAEAFLSMPRRQHIPRRLSGDLVALLPNVARNLPNSITSNYPIEGWQANSALEAKGGLGGSIDYEYQGARLGTLKVQIGSEKAAIEVVNNPHLQPRDKTATQLLEALPRLTSDFTSLVRQMKPKVESWIQKLPQGIIEENVQASQFTENQLMENHLDFLIWVQNVFPVISEDVRNFITEEKDPAKRSLAAALLLRIGRGHEHPRNIMQFLDEPQSNPSRDMPFLHGSVLELLCEKNALEVRRYVEQGDLASALGRLLKGETIEVDRLAPQSTPRSTATRSVFGLTEEYAKRVVVEGEKIIINVADMGKDKAGYVMNAVVSAINLLEELAGVNLFSSYSLTYGGVRQELFPDPRAPLMSNALFLEGERGDLNLYQPTVRQKINAWKDRGYMVATLIGSTGAGKTTLARNMFHEFMVGIDYSDRDVLVYEARAEMDELGTPTILSPDRLLATLREYRELLQARQGKGFITALVVDNFHLLPFREMSPETQREILNEFDAIGNLFAQGERRGGVIFLGENLPPGLDMSILQQHRAEWVDLSVKGRKAIFDSAVNIFAYRTQAMLSQVRDEILRAARVAGQEKTINQTDIDAVLTCCRDHFKQVLKVHSDLSRLASDENKGSFLTLSHWAGLADSILPRLREEAYNYLDTGKSEWLRKGQAKESIGIQLTNKGSSELRQQLNTAMGKVYELASTTADSKLGTRTGKRPEAPPKSTVQEPARKKQVPVVATAERVEPSSKAADLAERIASARNDLQSKIAALTDLEVRLTTLQHEKEAQVREVQATYGEGVRFFTEEGLLALLLDQEGQQSYFEDPTKTSSFIETLAEELSDSGSRWLEMVNRATNNEFQGRLEQIGPTALRVIMTQVDNRSIWENPEVAKSLSSIVLNQIGEIRKILGEKGLGMLSSAVSQVRQAFSEPDTSEIESQLQALGF